jgi:hypothetical protein
MTAETLFSLANFAALAAWLLLVASVVLKRPFWRDELAGRWVPLGLAALYTLLILFFFGASDGGFDTLENVQKLFASPWVALAGWVHYLAFDLFIGALIARRVMKGGLPRWSLALLLPLTFMFGPIGLLGFEIAKLLFSKTETMS